MTRNWIAALLAGVAAASAGCDLGGGADKAGGDRSGAPVVLTLATYDDNPYELGAFVREVARRSHGSLQIELKYKWRDGDPQYERRTFEDVRAHKADMGRVAARAFDTVGVGSFEPLLAPLAVDSYALQRRVLASGLADGMLRGLDRAGVVGIALLPGELRRPLGVSRPLLATGDYRGARVGTRPSRLIASTFKALGSTPGNYLPGADIRGFDAAETGVHPIEGDRLDGPARTFATNVVLWPRPVAIVVNRDVYAGLDESQRAALRDAGRAVVGPMSTRLVADDREAADVLCNRKQIGFRTATPAQLRDLSAATAGPRLTVARDPAGRDAVRQIAAMRAEVTPEPPPSCAADAVLPSRGSQGTPVDGSWRMVSTAGELARIDPEAAVPENWGKQTFAMKAGKFAFTEENAEACIWGYGTYSVKGHVLELRFQDGGGDAPTNANNRPGEFFKYRWSRYRDRLTLRPVKGATSPSNFRVNPWRRLGGEPTVDVLSPRCKPPVSAGLQP